MGHSLKLPSSSPLRLLHLFMRPLRLMLSCIHLEKGLPCFKAFTANTTAGCFCRFDLSVKGHVSGNPGERQIFTLRVS